MEKSIAFLQEIVYNKATASAESNGFEAIYEISIPCAGLHAVFGAVSLYQGLFAPGIVRVPRRTLERLCGIPMHGTIPVGNEWLPL